MTTAIAAPPADVVDRGRTTVVWAVSLFAASVLLQRFSLPGGVIPLLLPLTYGWMVWGWRRGVVELDRRRSRMLIVAAALTAGVALAQGVLVIGPDISLLSWGFLFGIWALAAVRMVDRSRDVVVRVMRGCVSVGRWLSVGCLVMMGAQFAGLPYSDYLASVVPRTLLVQGYVITYPLSYTSPIYRANAWIGLEPSIVSLQLGVCFLLAVLLRMRIRTLLLLGAGIAATLSGSGVFVIVIGIVVLLISRYRRHLRGYFAASAVGVALVLLTPFGQQMASRITELSKSGSSASLRSIDPYAYLWARWTSDTLTAVLGHGAGSSQKIITDSGIPGLLVPSPIKVFFDYGLIAGVALALYLLFCYVGGPSRAVAVALLASSWVLQPGTTTFVLVLPTLLFVTWWAPRASPMLELDPLRTREGLE